MSEKTTHETEDDIEAVAEAIEMVDVNSSEHYAKAAIAALEQRGWRRLQQTPGA